MRLCAWSLHPGDTPAIIRPTSWYRGWTAPPNRRVHYCGTCKTMGSLYGQRSRVLLNFDAVFLAELLTALSSGPGGSPEWSGAYRSYNCFSLPKTAEEMPPGMQVAAAATIVLA